ncbi:hypothetical protein GCM10027436_80390 [Actinophytocola sediminis]
MSSDEVGPTTWGAPCRTSWVSFDVSVLGSSRSSGIAARIAAGVQVSAAEAALVVRWCTPTAGAAAAELTGATNTVTASPLATTATADRQLLLIGTYLSDHPFRCHPYRG